MTASARALNPSDAASALGVSIKALRLYEERGLITPARTAAGWRTYGPTEMARAAEIVALRALGFSIAQVARAMDGDTQGLEQALAAHQATLEGDLRRVAETVERVRWLRSSLAVGNAPSVAELARLRTPGEELAVSFALPWPWGGERFELRGLRPLTYITGPLFCGKTKLAHRIAETLPGARFVGLEREATRIADPNPKSRDDDAIAWLIEDGATPSSALIALVTALAAEGPRAFVVDMIEHGLDEPTQQALMVYLRTQGVGSPLFVLTRSTAILDLATVGPNETIIFCPANHSPPMVVSPHPGAPGYEAVATCLAAPDVRARTAGVIAVRPSAA